MSDEQVTFDQFAAIDIRVGRIVEIEDFPQARKPAWKLRVDFGPELGVQCGERRMPAVVAVPGLALVTVRKGRRLLPAARARACSALLLPRSLPGALDRAAGRRRRPMGGEVLRRAHHARAPRARVRVDRLRDREAFEIASWRPRDGERSLRAARVRSDVACFPRRISLALIDHDRSRSRKFRHAGERRLTQIFVFVLSRGMEENGASTRPPPVRALPPSSPTLSFEECAYLRVTASSRERASRHLTFGRSASRSVAVFRVDDVSGLRAATLRTDPSPSMRTRG